MGVTEEEIQDMQKRAAWESAAAAAQTAKDNKDAASRADPGPADPNQSPDTRSALARSTANDFVSKQAPLLGMSPPPAAPPPAGTNADPFGLGVGGPPSVPMLKGDPSALPVREVNGAPVPAADGSTGAPNIHGVPGGIGAPRPPTTDDDLVLPPPGSPAGGAGRVIPGHLQIASQERDVKEGKEVSPEVKNAYGAASRLGLDAGQIEHDAQANFLHDKENLERLKLQAGDQAMLQHQRTEEDRQRLTQQKLDDIEALNKKAMGAPEDLWSTGKAFAKVIGMLMTGIGFTVGAKGGRGGPLGTAVMAAGMGINSAINEDIKNKMDQRAQAGAQAKRQTDLLHLHLDAFADKDKAIDATKLAYYDNVLQNMEAIKAGPYGQQINDANYLKLQQDLLDNRAKTVERIRTKEQSDIEGKTIAKMTNPITLGGVTSGVATGIRDHERVITIPASDRTGEHETHVAVPVEVYSKLAEKAAAANQIVTLDREALAKRAELRKVIADPNIGLVEKAQRRQTIQQELSKAWLERVNATSTAQGQGVVRKEDFDNEVRMGLQYDSGINGNDVLINGDKAIQHSSNLTTATMDAQLRGVGGWVVKPSIVQEHNKDNPHAPPVIRPGFTYTGGLYRGRPTAPEGDTVK